MFERVKYKNFAKQQLNGRTKVPFLMTFLILIVTELFSIPTQKISISTPELASSIKDIIDSGNYENFSILFQNYYSFPRISGSFLIEILSFLVTSIISFSALKVYMIMTRSPQPVSFKSFIEAMNEWNRAILANLYEAFRLFLWALIPIAVMIISCIVLIVVLITVAADDSSRTPLVILAVVLPVLEIISFIPFIIKSYAYSLTSYFAAEYSSIPITKALVLSNKITKHNKWNLFVMDLTFIGWILVGALSLGIGFLWITPYMTLTQVNAYHALLKQALTSGDVKPEELSSSSYYPEAFSETETSSDNDSSSEQTSDSTSGPSAENTKSSTPDASDETPSETPAAPDNEQTNRENQD